MINSVNVEKAFDKLQQLFCDKKTLNKLRREMNFLNLIKDIYKKPRANIICDGEKQSFPIEIKHKARMFSHHSFSPDVLADVIRQEREIKCVWIRKE